MRKCVVCNFYKERALFPKNRTTNKCTECFNKYRTDVRHNKGISRKRHGTHIPANNLENSRYGNLLVTNKYKYVKGFYWLCICDCGKDKYVNQQHLFMGKTKSCGCGEHKTGKESKAWKGVGDLSATRFQRIKGRAKKANIEFSITKEYLWELFIKQNRKCALSGTDLFLDLPRNAPYSASLDRIDSSKGYIEGNVQWVHKSVNIHKLDMDNEEFIQLCNRIAKTNPR